MTSPPLFSYFPPYTLHHQHFSAIYHLIHDITSLFQLFPALHHITSIFQLFPVLHVTSPPFFSYYPPYTSRHLLLQSRPILYTRQPPSPVISHLIRHYVTPFFSSFPFYTTPLGIQITYDTKPVRNSSYALQSPFHAQEDFIII